VQKREPQIHWLIIIIIIIIIIPFPQLTLAFWDMPRFRQNDLRQALSLCMIAAPVCNPNLLALRRVKLDCGPQ
jgi:hypothetical protein